MNKASMIYHMEKSIINYEIGYKELNLKELKRKYKSLLRAYKLRLNIVIKKEAEVKYLTRYANLIENKLKVKNG